MAEACLENTNQELKIKGWGTTNIVVIYNKDDKAIYVGVDTRSTSNGIKGSIVLEDAKKFFFMESCNVFATMAGYSTHCENMLNYVEDCLTTYEEIVNGIHDAPKIAHKYIHDWQKSTLELYQGSVYMVGWDADGLPHVYKVDSSGPVKKTKSKRCYGFANGTGGKQVREYFKSFNVEVQSSNELLETVTRALLYAALFDDRSGGYLRVFKVKQSGFDDLYHKSVLEALFDHYDALAGHLSKSFFFLFPKRDYKPTHDINVKVHKGFKRKFRKEYKDNVVIKQGRRFVIRLVHFYSIPDELYEQIRKQNLQNNVPREVQALPWVLIEQFGRVPILFCKPTQEVMRDLQDV